MSPFAEVEYALASIDKRMVIDPCEQYARPIDVPFKKTKVPAMYLCSRAVACHLWNVCMVRSKVFVL